MINKKTTVRQKQKKDAKTLLYLHVIKPLLPLDNFIFFDLKEIKTLKRNSVDEIYIGDLLDYLTNEEATLAIHEISQKIKKKGILHIQSNDARAIATAFLYNNINITIYKNILFSYQKKNIFTLGEIKTMIQHIESLTIDKCRFINGVQYYLECTRK